MNSCKPLAMITQKYTNSIKIKKGDKTRLEATKQTKSKNTIKDVKPYNHIQTATQYL
jgi:hypothetical protein